MRGINEYFVDESVANFLKETFNFKEKCIARYRKGIGLQMNHFGDFYNHNSGEISTNYVSAPLIEQVRHWLEDEYQVYINCTIHNYSPLSYSFKITDKKGEIINEYIDSRFFYQGLNYAIFETLGIIRAQKGLK